MMLVILDWLSWNLADCLQNKRRISVMRDAWGFMLKDHGFVESFKQGTDD